MNEDSNPLSSNQWSGAFGGYYSGYNQSFKNEGSSTAAPLASSGSTSNGDAMNALISIVGTEITKSYSELKGAIGDVKRQ